MSLRCMYVTKCLSKLFSVECIYVLYIYWRLLPKKKPAL